MVSVCKYYGFFKYSSMGVTIEPRMSVTQYNRPWQHLGDQVGDHGGMARAWQ